MAMSKARLDGAVSSEGVLGVPAHMKGLESADLSGSFQPNAFCDSVKICTKEKRKQQSPV